MTNRAKYIYRKSVFMFNAADKKAKQEMIETVKKQLETNTRGLETIGIGLDKDMVTAGEVFLRTNRL